MSLSTNKRPMIEAAWNRCDICGKFIAFEDFPSNATRNCITPLSDFSREEWETYHHVCFLERGQ